MRKVGAFAGTFIAIVFTGLGFVGLAQAAPTDTTVAGTLSKAENTCVSPIAIFTNDPPQLCSYSGGEDVIVAAGSGKNRIWMGPDDSGGFYLPGDGPNPLTTDGSTPGDGKENLVITGTIRIEDNNTPANGLDDSISGTLVIAESTGGERSVSTSDGTALECFSKITHTIPVKVVDDAQTNGLGGYDYVIGTEGYPLLLKSGGVPPAMPDDYPSESASIVSGSPSPPDLNVWDVVNGGNVNVTNFPFPLPPPPFSAGPYTVEIVSYAPGTANGGNVEPNFGVATTAVKIDRACGLSPPADPLAACVSGDGQGNAIEDCDFDPDDPEVGSSTVWTHTGAEFDNLIIKLASNANDQVVSVDAFYAIEYRIPQLNGNSGKPGSYIGGTLHLDVVIEANDDSVKTLPLPATVDIDILANDTGFADDVTISLPADPGIGLPGGGVTVLGGSVTINGLNPGPQDGIDVTYTPPAGIDGLPKDQFKYTIVDAGGETQTASVFVTVSSVLAQDLNANTGEQQPVDIVITEPPAVFGAGLGTITIPIGSEPTSGTATVAGQTITYTPGGPGGDPDLFKFPASDTFEYRIEDSLGKFDTGTIDVAIGPPLEPTAVDDTAMMMQDTSLNIDVTANDTAGSGAISDHTLTIIFEPLNGTAVVEADNTITYTPDPGVSGVHLFRYELADTGSSAAETDAGGTEIGPKPDVDEAEVTVTVEKVEVDAKLPSGDGSATGPWSLLFLAVIAWLRRRALMIRP